MPPRNSSQLSQKGAIKFGFLDGHRSLASSTPIALLRIEQEATSAVNIEKLRTATPGAAEMFTLFLSWATQPALRELAVDVFAGGLFGSHCCGGVHAIARRPAVKPGPVSMSMMATRYHAIF